MTPVAIVALVDIVLIAIALAIVLSTGISQRRELRRLRPEASRRPRQVASTYALDR